MPIPAGIWNKHLHKACQQKQAWSALKCPGRWLLTTENTVDQHQQLTWQPKSSLTVETSHWISSNMNSVPLHSSSRLWDLDFSLAQVRCFWGCFCFRSGLVALFLKMSGFGYSWMHWLQLQFTPCEALPSVWIGFAWQYSEACGHPCCLCKFSYTISFFQSTLHLICFDTALLEQLPLSVMTLCVLPSLWRESMIVFWTIAKSAVFPIIVVSKNKKCPQFKLYRWSFIESHM